MLFYILLWNLVFNSLTFCGNTTLTENNSNRTLVLPKEIPKNKLTLLTEGGAMVTDTPILSFPKVNRTVLMNIDSEFGIEKQKPIHPRKGAPVYNVSEENDTPKYIPKVEPVQNLNSTNTTESALKIKQQANSSRATDADNNIKVKNNTGSINGISQINNTSVIEHIKKPTILSYDVLAAMDVSIKNGDHAIPDTKSSSNPVIDQMPSPNAGSFTMIKSNLISTSKNPGMVMPLVITVLIVPAFAVLGYMAFRRGKEAWKNRHYKRMDFLLDGMYND